MAEHTERWLPVVGAEGYYEISSHGRVRSVNRVIIRSNQTSQTRRGQLLKPRPDEIGRLRVSIRAPGMPGDIRISRLVLTAFVGPPPDGMEGCHNDGDVSNNHHTNLRWDTHKENCLDIVRHGHNYWRNKEQCPRNHPLAEPNLIASMLAKGNRACLACSWANSASTGISTWNKIKQSCPYSFEDLADAYYAKIMGLPAPDPTIILPRAHKERTHCIRNHPLVKPNLVPSALKKNKRICQACQRALTESWNANKRGQSVNVDALADQYYDALMSTG